MKELDGREISRVALEEVMFMEVLYVKIGESPNLSLQPSVLKGPDIWAGSLTNGQYKTLRVGSFDFCCSSSGSGSVSSRSSSSGWPKGMSSITATSRPAEEKAWR